ncbi:unnamed protein product [Mycena citricolor]|nr:unnamed protein product [Mycena citricolor]
MLVLSVARLDNCQIMASLAQAGSVLVVAGSAAIITFRTGLLWDDHQGVLAPLGAMGMLVTTAWIVLATNYRATSSEFVLVLNGNCRISPTVVWLPLANTAFLIFLLSALVLSLFKIRFFHPRDSRVAYNMYRDYVACVTGITCVTLAALIIEGLAPRSGAFALSSKLLQIVFVAALSSRAFQNYLLADVIEADGSHVRPYPTSFTTVSHTSELKYPNPSPSRSPNPASASPLMTFSPTSPFSAVTPSPFSPAPSSSPTGRSRLGSVDSNAAAPVVYAAPSTLAGRNRLGSADSAASGTANTGNILAGSYTKFPSPPASYENASPLTGASSSRVATTGRNMPVASSSVASNSKPRLPTPLAPLRRNDKPRSTLPAPPLSGWSDS